MVKEGYKETEIGVIPEEWESVALLSKCELLNGLTYTPNDMADNGLLVIRSSNVQNNQLIFSDNVYVDLTVADEKLIKKDDIIICVRNGSAALIGKCAKASRDYPITFGAFMAVLRGENNGFIYQLLQQGTIQKHISKNSGATINQITNGDFKTIFVPFPTDLKEQERIAGALSDMDKLISSLEKLIEKKKAIKQGAMQELLTGGKQLYSNANELEEIPIKDLFSYINGKSLEEFFNYNSGYKVISIGNYSSEGTFIDTNTYIDHSYKAQFHNLIASNNDLVMILNDKTSIGTILGRVLLIDKDDSYIINQRSVILRLKNDKFCAKYFYYLLNSKYVRKNIMKKSKPGTQIYLNLPDVLELSVKYTSDIKEQQIIANTLSDIDAEIAALEQKLTKCQKLKQGMMQQLLTGKIRLI